MVSDKKKVNLRKFLSYYKPYKGLLAADMICSALSAMFALVIPICIRYITKDVLEGGMADASNVILRMGALMLALITAQTAVSLFSDYKGHDLGARIERDMRRELFAHMQKLSFSFFDSQKVGKLMSRLTNDLLNLAELFHHGPENLVIHGLEFAGAFAILLYINPVLTLTICALLPVMAIYSSFFYRKLQRVYRISRERIADVNSQAEESLSGIRIVKSFTNEDIEIERFTAANNRFYQSRAGIYLHEALHSTVMDKFFTRLISASIVVFGGIRITQASLDLADLLVFILYASYLTAPIPRLSFMVQQFQDGLAGYGRFREIMDTMPEIRDRPDAAVPEKVEGRVEFRNVTFKYFEGQRNILHNINLDVPAGETIAIVGHSGVGKTTLCSLIPRFYEADEGEIRIDGMDVRDVTLQSLRRHVGVVQQDNFLFGGTVLENILYGRPGASFEDVIEAAKKANAHEFISELPDGYDTDIGQRGVKLSGGQKQRICIARVFLKNPPILIFDEATGSLDYESEKFVMESLRSLSEGRTTFIIAHRLSTIRNADRIVTLSIDGITEQGTHEKLLAQNGVYARLYNSQE